MKDRKGKEIKAGDSAMIPATVVSVHPRLELPVRLELKNGVSVFVKPSEMEIVSSPSKEKPFFSSSPVYVSGGEK